MQASLKSQIVTWVTVLPLVLFMPLWPLLLVYLVYCTKYGILSLLYMAWMVYDGRTGERGGRRFECMRKLPVFKTFSDYFPIKLVKTAEFDPSKNYLLCAHPHGLVPIGGAINFGTEATGIGKLFPGIRPYLLTVEQHFYVPIHREFLINVIGAISSSADSIRYMLSNPKGGNALVLFVGGMAEMLDTHPNATYVIHLSQRKGFIRLALQHGAPLVPVFTFGENDVTYQVPNPPGSFLRKCQNLMVRKFRIPCINPLALIPKSQRLVTVVGKPLEFDKILEPTEDDIATHHAKYIEALKELFYSHRDACGESDREIEIV